VTWAKSRGGGGKKEEIKEEILVLLVVGRKKGKEEKEALFPHSHPGPPIKGKEKRGDAIGYLCDCRLNMSNPIKRKGKGGPSFSGTTPHQTSVLRQEKKKNQGEDFVLSPFKWGKEERRCTMAVGVMTSSEEEGQAPTEGKKGRRGGKSAPARIRIPSLNSPLVVLTPQEGKVRQSDQGGGEKKNILSPSLGILPKGGKGKRKRRRTLACL